LSIAEFVDEAGVETNPEEFGGEVETASRVRVKEERQHVDGTRSDHGNIVK
jgi:hypothetical protein